MAILEFEKVYELSIWSKHGWATNKAKEIHIYALYIFRIKCFIVPTDIIKSNTLTTAEITQLVSQQKTRQLLS